MKKHTEKEIFESHSQNLYLIDKMLHSGKVSENEIGDFIPGLFHLNSREDMTVEYISQTGLDYFGLTQSELQGLGVEFFKRCLSPETTNVVMPRFAAFSDQNDKNTIYSDFQIVRRDYDHKFETFISNLKLLKDRNQFAVITTPIKSFGNAAHKLERLLGEERFFRKNYKRFMSLSRREKEILSLLAHGHSNKEIGDRLYISSHTVRTHRNRIYQKLDIRKVLDVIKYAQAFDLI